MRRLPRHLACLSVLLAATALLGCGSESIHDQNERIASQLTNELQVAVLDTSFDGQFDVRCARPRTHSFDCHAYRFGQGATALQTTYLVHECEQGGWRARSRAGGASGFPARLRYDTNTDLVSPDCYP